MVLMVCKKRVYAFVVQDCRGKYDSVVFDSCIEQESATNGTFLTRGQFEAYANIRDKGTYRDGSQRAKAIDFPRIQPHPNTLISPWAETGMIVANNRVHHGRGAPSCLHLPIVFG